MKKSRLIIVSLIVAIIVVAAVNVILHRQATEKHSLANSKVTKIQKKRSRSKSISGSLEGMTPGESILPLSTTNSDIVVKRVKPFPQTLMGSDPPALWADANQPTNAVGAAIIAFQSIELKYPNGFVLERDYRYPDDPTLHNWKAQVEQGQKEHVTYFGGVSDQLIDINGHEALARENIPDDGQSHAFPRGGNIQWYVKPFLYVLWGPNDMPLAKVIPAAEEITTFADKNIPQDLPPYAANTPYGYDQSILTNQGNVNPAPPQAPVSPPGNAGSVPLGQPSLP